MDNNTDCDHYTISWTHWLDWGIDQITEHSIKRSRQRYCLHDIGIEPCLFQEQDQEDCCIDDPIDCTGEMTPCYSILE